MSWLWLLFYSFLSRLSFACLCRTFYLFPSLYIIFVFLQVNKNEREKDSHPHMCEGWAAPSVHLVEGWPPAEDGWPLSHPVHRVSGRRYGHSADPQNTGRKQIIGIFHIRCERTYHRRRIKTEEKEQVVASVWGQECTQFLAALAVLLRRIFNNWMNCTRMNSLYS